MKYESLEYLDPETLDISKLNPRDGQFELEELKDSIQKNGIVEPIIVRKIQKGERKGEREVLVGGRRVVAAERLRIEEVPCLTVKCTDDQALRKALVSNIVKKDLEPVEIANAVKFMMQRFPEKYRSIPDVANELGKSTSTIVKIMKVLEAPSNVRDEITTKKKAEKGEGVNLEQAIAIEEEARSLSDWKEWINKAKENQLSASKIKSGMRKERKERQEEDSEETPGKQKTLISPIHKTKKPQEFSDILEDRTIYLDESVVEGQEITVASKAQFKADEVTLDREAEKWKVKLKQEL